jgi:hypothetical protein
MTIRPNSMHLSIGGHFGCSHVVELCDGKVRYTAAFDGKVDKVLEVDPTEEQWEEFRASLDAVHFWEWREEYPNPGVLDGTSWSVQIEYPDARGSARGQNNYPLAHGRPSGNPQSSGPFMGFLSAVRRLLGGLELY